MGAEYRIENRPDGRKVLVIEFRSEHPKQTSRDVVFAVHELRGLYARCSAAGERVVAMAQEPDGRLVRVLSFVSDKPTRGPERTEIMDAAQLRGVFTRAMLAREHIKVIVPLVDGRYRVELESLGGLSMADVRRLQIRADCPWFDRVTRRDLPRGFAWRDMNQNSHHSTGSNEGSQLLKLTEKVFRV